MKALLLIATLALAAPATAQELTVGSFTVLKNTDPINDTDRSSAFTVNEDKRAMGFRCLADGLNVTYLWSRYFMGDDSRITVVHRFPPGQAMTRQWHMATNHQAAFLPMRDVPAFVQSALTTGTVVLRVTDRDGDQITDQFKLDGLVDALKHLPCYKP